MSELVVRCQRRAHLENDLLLITGPEWKALISEKYAPLYSSVVSSGLFYFYSEATITATGAANYPVPADHDETIGVDRVVDPVSGRRVFLDEVMIQERNYLSGTTGDAIGYALLGQNVVLYPRPTTGTYIHVYVPQSPDLSQIADAATVDMVTGDGEEYLIANVAITAIGKRDGDAALVTAERDKAERAFRVDVQRRALINPRRRVPQRRRQFNWADDDWDWESRDPGDWRNR